MNRVVPGDRVVVHNLIVPNFEGGYVYESVDQNYIKSSSTVIFNGLYGAKPKIVTNADSATFRPVKNGFMRDKNSLFYLGKEVEDINPDTVTFETVTATGRVWEVMVSGEYVWAPTGCGPYLYEKIATDSYQGWSSPC
jgi:hypothetical protein